MVFDLLGSFQAASASAELSPSDVEITISQSSTEQRTPPSTDDSGSPRVLREAVTASPLIGHHEIACESDSRESVRSCASEQTVSSVSSPGPAYLLRLDIRDGPRRKMTTPQLLLQSPVVGGDDRDKFQTRSATEQYFWRTAVASVFFFVGANLFMPTALLISAALSYYAGTIVNVLWCGGLVQLTLALIDGIGLTITRPRLSQQVESAFPSPVQYTPTIVPTDPQTPHQPLSLPVATETIIGEHPVRVTVLMLTMSINVASMVEGLVLFMTLPAMIIMRLG
ncbi:hypothetical protein J8273_4121 [Carpediemonas membranifera]|uniref:Uncharacterized protein n=1 Tax=Carpediemonas membranifera TaxID=201153 RepID=A0A8J6ATU8_9EUKA|nr:hypothetical protein J8273_4121 [Carpediemonas membranifera]|eukprot:KAG9394456.1 hypothetical protein J8273_4121 [Carpediemonas membranifera]